jgi:DNA-binding MarR family transcriptional regulator
MNADVTGSLLREVTRRYTRAQRAVAAGCDTTAMQCHLLCELARSGALSVGALAQRLGFEKSWISRSVDKALASGLVRKASDPADGRGVLVSLTAAGRTRARALDQGLARHADQLLRLLTPAERTGLRHSLATLLKSLEGGSAE